jgi:aquaporin NIP
MADHTTMSGEDQRRVAISVCSTPSHDRSLAGAPAAASTPRPSKLVPLDSLQRLMFKSPLPPVQDDEPKAPVPLVKKVAAEFVGTFILMFTVVSAIVADAHQPGGAGGVLGVAAAAGLAVVAVVLAVVDVSGSHLNPAVSVAMAAFGHLPLSHVAPYAAAQTLGSAAATFLAKGMYRPADPGVMATVPRGCTTGEAFLVELALTFVLVFVIAAVATDPASSKEAVAVSIAAAITMNALAGASWTGPSMNPARTIGAAVATGKYKDIWVYLVAPTLGAIAGAGTYTLIKH